MRFNSAVVLVEFDFGFGKSICKAHQQAIIKQGAKFSASVKGLKIQANFSQLCCDYTNKGVKVLLSLLCGSFL